MHLYRESPFVKENLGRFMSAQHYWDQGWLHPAAVFHLWADVPVIMPDVAVLAAFLHSHRFSAVEAAYLASLGLAERFLNALQRMPFGLTLYAAEPGALLAPRQSLLAVQGTYIEAQARSVPILHFLQPEIPVPLQYDLLVVQDANGNWRPYADNPPSMFNFEDWDWLQPIFVGGRWI